MATKTKTNKRVLTIGNKVFIRTVTHYHTGKIIYIDKDVIELEDAAWIADTGRFSDALKNAQLNEVEPFPSAVAIGRGAIVDVTLWTGELPRGQK